MHCRHSMNTLLLAMLHQIHRPRKANLLFIAGLGVSNWLCSIGCLILQCHRIMIFYLQKEHQLWTLDDFFALPRKTAAWAIAFMDMHRKVSALCHMRECINPIIYRSTAWTYMIIGYLTVVFYLATVALLLHRRSTTCTIMRQMQLNRERSIARSIAFVILCTFVCQILPWTLELVLTDKHVLHSVSLPLRTMNWSLTPTIYLVIHPDLRKQMKNFFNRIRACSQQSRGNLNLNSVYVGYPIN
ncbi:Platelet-activating factor receptor [Trichinella spiralis]|uniref:Platelet-activating factor receptor n=1 Tax=Trichinella spiralis TaxID=6334 RepID=A0ABR3KN86_TRISP